MNDLTFLSIIMNSISIIVLTITLCKMNKINETFYKKAYQAKLEAEHARRLFNDVL